MRLARIETSDGPVTGQYQDDVVHTADGTYEAGIDGNLLLACEPSALYCVGRNYAETLEQMEYERPEEPDFFIKSPASLRGHRLVDPLSRVELTYAGELAAVIDEPYHDLSEDEVSEVVRGYTIMDDVDALDQQGRTARKAFDGSGPLGPWIETDIDPTGIDMYTYVNDERRQEANTELVLSDPYEIISYLSKRFTFRPGDVVAFGSPANPGLIKPGDTIEITYENIGTLRNPVVGANE
ncbi:LOW QUALITY PROTEIN: 2-keto-4-pentenoate hydratase/2-oxohepta-3-ene-1,7-dioic acid hydratase in catechol pathway [Halopiger aswanensis]|uniref:2-keto-4-pentenoate hydratase/2-oxohepta-3-ene-1,7-dioic acid hydratase in catechol pathway n=1 Tax=Halopiger aswanensis TaxID=148449 RepID=A0A419VY79_9EURY|nr:LOW QUALITY PROTEIN: 2-keto-4-pentenoate hydratase/2-oxohepta-3-ene-1,7-dioic acid hydratase in catechol pathway [Halopiger aswanensis]